MGSFLSQPPPSPPVSSSFLTFRSCISSWATDAGGSGKSGGGGGGKSCKGRAHTRTDQPGGKVVDP